jgi:hypothetical protein
MLKTVSSITNALGALNYKGTWNASTNTPTLASGTGTKGDYYVVSVAGTTTLDGISNWGVGDWATYNGSVWQRVEGGADLNGVNLTATGNATISGTTQSGSIGIGEVPDTASSRLIIKSLGTTSATNVLLGRNSSDSNQISVRSDGVGFLNAAAWVYGSDATIKENIEYLDPSNCLALISNAKPAKFDYIEGQKENFGYIAQDIQTWLPEAISQNPNGKLGLQDGFINALGTGAIQALHQLAQTQAETIAALTARISVLEAK